MSEALDALVSRGQRALDSIHDTSELLADLRIERRSPDGLVTATVDSHGALIDLALANDLSRESPARLEAVIVETATQATRDALTQRDAILRSMQTSLSET